MDANQLESAMNNLIEFLWEQWHPDAKEIVNLLRELLANDQLPFPENGKLKDAPRTQGVYIIRENGTVLHVGRTYDGKEGLSQRLNNHLSGSSSFAKNYLKVKKKNIRGKDFTYQVLVEKDDKKRAYLENLATGILHPKHIGTGRKKHV
jgi:hypothetical protein